MRSKRIQVGSFVWTREKDIANRQHGKISSESEQNVWKIKFDTGETKVMSSAMLTVIDNVHHEDIPASFRRYFGLEKVSSDDNGSTEKQKSKSRNVPAADDKEEEINISDDESNNIDDGDDDNDNDGDDDHDDNLTSSSSSDSDRMGMCSQF